MMPRRSSAGRQGPVPSRRPPGSDAETIALLLGALVFVLGALSWVAVELAGVLARGSWPRVPFADAWLLLAGMLRHRGAWAAAWPRSFGEAPPEALFYPLAAALASVAAGLFLLLRRLAAAGGGRAAPGGHLAGARRAPLRLVRWPGALGQRHLGAGARGARWARPADLRVLCVSRAEKGRLVLGRAGSRCVATEARQSVIVVGPTQTQKTSGFAVPAILEWEGPVLATSVKSDLVRDTIGWREGCGPVWVYDPAASTGMPGSTWSPLATSADWLGARRMAAALTSAARSGESGLDDADFWYATAAKLLGPLLLAAACTGAGMVDVLRWVEEQEVAEVEGILCALGVPEARRAFRASIGREDRQRSSVYTTAETVLECFADPCVAASAAHSEIDPRVLLDGGAGTLFVCAPAHEQQRLRPVFTALVSHVLVSAYEMVARRAAPLDPPLLVVLDEAANVAPVPELDALASTAAGHGIQLVTIWQDMAQISARYGPRCATVVNNHRAKVVLSGISDPATLDHVSVLVGDEEVPQSSTTTDADGRRATTESFLSRRLAPADALRRIRPGEGILVYGHLPPAALRLRPWFADRELSRRRGARRPGPATDPPAGRGSPAGRAPGWPLRLDRVVDQPPEQHGQLSEVGGLVEIGVRAAAEGVGEGKRVREC